MALVNAPGGAAALLGELPAGATVIGDPATADVTLLFAERRADLEREGDRAIPAFADDRVLWLCYPKGGARAGTDIGRDMLRVLVPRWGMDTVTLVALDERWSALRIRPAGKVGSRAG